MTNDGITNIFETFTLAALKPDPDVVVFAHSLLCLFIVIPACYLHFMERNVRIH